jgi:hypothetical protein
MKNLSEDSRSTGRDLNPGLPEYEAGVLISRPRRSVRRHYNEQQHIKGTFTDAYCYICEVPLAQQR